MTVDTGYRPGQQVTIHTRDRYDARHGTVVATHLGEVGVNFGRGDDVDAWFRPGELTRGVS